jgi:hypothetical protein
MIELNSALLAEPEHWKWHLTVFINDVMSRQQVPVLCDGHHCISLDQYKQHTKQAVTEVLL